MAAELSDHERQSLEDLGREALRCAASAPDATLALAWAQAGCDCLRVAAAPAGALAEAGTLFDRMPAGAPFTADWEKITAPIAARAEAVHVLDIEREIDREADRLERS